MSDDNKVRRRIRRPQELVNYSEAYLDCRDFNHAWAKNGAYKVSGSSDQVRMLRCLRCGTVRRDHLDKYLDIRSRQYSYPPDYKLNAKFKKVEFRKEQMRRVEVRVVKKISDIEL